MLLLGLALAFGLFRVILRELSNGLGGFQACDSEFDQIVKASAAGALGFLLVARLARHVLGLNGLQGRSFK